MQTTRTSLLAATLALALLSFPALAEENRADTAKARPAVQHSAMNPHYREKQQQVIRQWREHRQAQRQAQQRR